MTRTGNRCRRASVQIGTIDALLAELCIRHKLVLLTAGKDFLHAAALCALRVWRPLNEEAAWSHRPVVPANTGAQRLWGRD